VDLRYYDILETANQMQYISHIKTLKTLMLIFRIPERMNMLIFPSTSITKLTLSIWSGSVCFDWLFLTFPSLEQLEIQGVGSWTTLDNCNNHCANMVPNLWKLQASVKLMDQKCIDFLKMAAPNIQEVKITASLTPTTHQVSIDISEWNLKQLGILIRDMTFMGSCYYRIKTPYLDEVIMYTPLHNSVALVKSKTCLLDTTAPRIIDIIASDNSHFTFFGCRISLTQSKITLTSSN
jgi:hypothetical protein